MLPDLLARAHDPQTPTMDALTALAELKRWLHDLEAELMIRARQERHTWQAIDEAMGRADLTQRIATWRAQTEEVIGGH